MYAKEEREKRKKEIIFILVSTFLIKLLGLSSKLLEK